MTDWFNEYLKEQQKTEALQARVDGLVDMLTKRFIRSTPVEEQLMAIGIGKRDLPTREECRQWAIKLGVPAEYEVLKENPNATPC